VQEAQTPGDEFSRSGSSPDPDQSLYLNYGCRGELNCVGYCRPEIDELIDRQINRRGRSGPAKAADLGNRTQAGRGWCPAHHFL
jgi:ABC-type transport system substrate-binding protein